MTRAAYVTAAVLAAATTFFVGWIVARMQRAAEPSWRDALEGPDYV